MKNNECGYLVIAQNNNDVNYVKLAYALALSLKCTQKKVSNLSIVVDENTKIPTKYKKVFDNVIDLPWGDLAKNSTWKVENKWKYYYCTPYKRTVALDSDMIFTSDLSHWWDILKGKDFCFTTDVVDYRSNVVSGDEIYRKFFIENNLTNVYTGYMYFEKTETTEEFIKIVDYVFQHWEDARKLMKNAPISISGDVAYAIALEIFGQDKKYETLNGVPKFTHMKNKCQNIPYEMVNKDWSKSIPYIFNDDCSLYINGYRQRYPFHYHVKEWMTDDKIKSMEKYLGIS